MLSSFLSRLFAPKPASRKASAEGRRARRNRCPSLKPPRARLAVEALEDRTLPAANFGWAAAFGSNALAKTLAVDSSNNVIIGGDLGQQPATFGSGAGAVTLTPVAQYQGFLAKYTSAGNLLWAELANRSVGNASAVDSAGNLLQGEQDATTNDLRLTKYDPNGNTLWSIDLSQAGISSGYGYLQIALDGSGNAYLTGRTPSSSSTFVDKFLGSNGSLAWSDQYAVGTINFNFPFIAVDPSGNVWTTGSYIGKQDFDPGAGTSYLTSFGKGGAVNAYVLELNGNGGFVWAGSMGTDSTSNGTYGASARGIAVDPSGNIYLAGGFHLGSKQNNFNPTGSSIVALTNTSSTYTGYGTYVVKLNASHAFQWADSYGVLASYANFSITVDATGALYLAGGNLKGTVDFDPGAGQQLVTASDNDLYVLKLDTTGSFDWVADLRADPNAGTNGGHVYGLMVDSLGNIDLSGSFLGTYDFDPGSGTYNLTSSGSSSGYVLQLTQSTSLLAAGGAVTVNPSTAMLTDAALQPIVAEAIALWTALGAAPNLLGGLTIRVASLGGATLASEFGTTILIDDNAAGYGWFVDPTPGDNSEFTTPGDQGEQNHMDLLTVVMHEIGDALGLDQTGGLIQETLAPGTRLLP
jgi:hypothetical protein